MNFFAKYPTTTVDAGVSSLNGLEGVLTLAAGANITITPSGGDTLTIAGAASGANVLLSNITDPATPFGTWSWGDSIASALVGTGPALLYAGAGTDAIMFGGKDSNHASNDSLTVYFTSPSLTNAAAVGQTGYAFYGSGDNLSNSGGSTGLVFLASGNGDDADTGDVYIKSGDTTTGNSGNIVIGPGASDTATVGHVQVNGNAYFGAADDDVVANASPDFIFNTQNANHTVAIFTGPSDDGALAFITLASGGFYLQGTASNEGTGASAQPLYLNPQGSQVKLGSAAATVELIGHTAGFAVTDGAGVLSTLGYGDTGSFTTTDLKTVTVVNGIITSIV